MKLTSAILCLNCDEVFEFDKTRNYLCPICSSGYCIPLNNFVNSVGVDTVVKVDTEVKLEEKKALTNQEGTLPEDDVEAFLDLAGRLARRESWK